MSNYLSEEEQVEMIRRWWNKYGNLISTAILLGILSIIGFQWWQRHQAKITFHASAEYQQLLNAITEKDDSGIDAHANSIITRFGHTPYATMSALLLARHDVDKKDYANALTQLQWVIDHSKDASFRQIARLRAAKVELAQNKTAEALSLLETVDDETFRPMIADLKGDCYVLLGKKEQARIAFTTALQTSSENAANRSLLKMKLIDIAEPGNPIAQRRSGVVI